ncbi:unnamed protein product [Caenorhabditis angaria]|uniref:RanBP2-type domain-containing protein n=1 Tax=Caenorhabditis angaria TaxID=860376 RepID=A0A9P1N2B5_9PELO|nr:unnamed protein product [Caenorhabditis angaria]
MDVIETPARSLPNICFFRYIDDIIVIAETNEDLDQIFKCLNSQSKFINLTRETPTNGWLPFLNFEIKLHNNNIVNRWYRKPSNMNLLVRMDSFHPIKQKSNIVCNTIRTAKLCSSPEYISHSTNMAKKVLEKNGYYFSNEKTKRSFHKKRITVPSNMDRCIMPIPFLGDAITKQIRNLLNSLSLEAQVIELKGRSLGDILTKNRCFDNVCHHRDCFICRKLGIGKCNVKGVVYKITCDCGEIYIGETEAPSFSFGKQAEEPKETPKFSFGKQVEPVSFVKASNSTESPSTASITTTTPKSVFGGLAPVVEEKPKAVVVPPTVTPVAPTIKPFAPAATGATSTFSFGGSSNIFGKNQKFQQPQQRVIKSSKFASVEIAVEFKNLFEKTVNEHKSTPQKAKTIDSEIKAAVVKKEEVKEEPREVVIPSNKKNVEFGDKFKPAAGSWECTECYVRNNAVTDICSCCGSGKDGKPADKAAAIFSKPSILQQPAGPPKFSFGMSAAAAATEQLAQSQTPQFSGALLMVRNACRRKNKFSRDSGGGIYLASEEKKMKTKKLF